MGFLERHSEPEVFFILFMYKYPFLLDLVLDLIHQHWTLGKRFGRGLGDRLGKQMNGRQSQWQALPKAPEGLTLWSNISFTRVNSVTSCSHLCLSEKNKIHIQHNSLSLVPKDLYFVLPLFLLSGKMAHLLNKVICTILLFAYRH